MQRAQSNETVEQRMAEIIEMLYNRELDITEYDDILVRKLVESITVISNKIKVEFKNGTEISVTWK